MAITQYLDLITSEHRNKPKFINWLSSALNKIDDGITVSNAIPSSFDVNTAVGNQLDIIGDVVGQKRDIQVPLASGSSVLDDAHYRLVLQAKIARNQWDGKMSSIYSIWQEVFPDTPIEVIDDQDMTMQALLTNLTDAISTDLVTAGFIIPKPMGVELIVIADTSISESQYLGGIVSGNDVVQLSVPDVQVTKVTSFLAPTQTTFKYEPN